MATTDFGSSLSEFVLLYRIRNRRIFERKKMIVLKRVINKNDFLKKKLFLNIIYISYIVIKFAVHTSFLCSKWI